MESAKIEKLICDILGDFQTLCVIFNCHKTPSTLINHEVSNVAYLEVEMQKKKGF